MLETGLKFYLKSRSRDWGKRGHTKGGGEGKSTGACANVCPAGGELSVESCWGVGCKEVELWVVGVEDSGQAALVVGTGEAGTICAGDHSPPVPGMASLMPKPLHFAAVSR